MGGGGGLKEKKIAAKNVRQLGTKITFKTANFDNNLKRNRQMGINILGVKALYVGSFTE